MQQLNNFFLTNHIPHLSKDKKLKKLIEAQEPYTLSVRKKVYLHLCSSILSQQLSTKVARVLYSRFIDLYGGKEPSAQQILETPQPSFAASDFQMQRLLMFIMFAGFLLTTT